MRGILIIEMEEQIVFIKSDGIPILLYITKRVSFSRETDDNAQNVYISLIPNKNNKKKKKNLLIVIYKAGEHACNISCRKKREKKKK